ncbi:hypothetical protein [Sagittula sp. MA-2]|jgi:hypothetical protein|uniref:hypothetical protein n=1 Tax=Sagittula sp. MA-2 TaxID=3048007 RepID=UPI0024C3C0E0|nr:hypothetical protein [Sagittula sp. MA-2]WHZ36016.1 hypothetical protein QNI11_03175 [Sagittula sp. MA-2]
METGSQRCFDAKRGTPIGALGLKPAEFIVLNIARHYFGAFSDPAEHGWLQAASDALACFGPERGPRAAMAVLSAVQSMRQARVSVFRFNSARCPRCSAFVSDHERMFLTTMRAVVRGNEVAAAGHAMLLCEGNDHSGFLRALAVLADDCGLFAGGNGAARADLVEAPPHAGL